MVETTPCLLCHCDDTAALFDTHDRLRHGPQHYHFVRCQRCGLIYLDPRPSWIERAPHYGEDYRGYHRLRTERSPSQWYSMAYGLRKRWRLVATHQHGGRLLDVGCAGGDFLHLASQQAGWRVYGLERVEAMARAARADYGLAVTLGDIMRAGLASESFDAVTLWTVLEHLQDPVQGVRECARLLRPGGILVVRTVTADSWGARIFGPCWVGYDAPRILFVFTRATLTRLLEEAGLDVLSLGSPFHDFHPYVWSWRNLCEARVASPAVRRLAIGLAGSWLARLLSAPFFVMQTWLGGDSFVTVVARRR